MKKYLFLYFIVIQLFSFSQEKINIEFGDNNDGNSVSFERNNSLNLFYSNTNVFSGQRQDKLINLTPLFITLLDFVEGINAVTDLKTEALKKEHGRLKAKVSKLSKNVNGNHIDLLDDAFRDFASFYLNVLETGAIQNRNSLNDAFVLINDYQNNKNNFSFEEVNGELFLSSKVVDRTTNSSDFEIFPSVDGMARVKNRNKYGFIDMYGQLVIKPIYDEVSDFSEGYAICKVGEFIYILDKNGQQVKNNNKLYVANNGVKVHRCHYGWFRVGHPSIFQVPGEQTYYDSFNYINSDLDSLFENRSFSHATDFQLGTAYVYDENDHCYYKINTKGGVVRKLDSTVLFVETNTLGISLFKKKVIKNHNGVVWYLDDYERRSKIVSRTNTDLNFGYNTRTYNWEISGDSLLHYSFATVDQLSIHTRQNELLESVNVNNIFTVYHGPNLPKMGSFSESSNKYVSHEYAICDSSENLLFGPFAFSKLLSNDFFLISNETPVSLEFVEAFAEVDSNLVPKKLNFVNLQKESYFERGFGIVMPNSQIISAVNSDYNILQNYTSDIFVIGKVLYSADHIDIPCSKEYGELPLDELAPIINVSYGLVNSQGVEALPFIYDEIKIVSNNIVQTIRGKEIRYFAVDSLGNTSEVPFTP